MFVFFFLRKSSPETSLELHGVWYKKKGIPVITKSSNCIQNTNACKLFYLPLMCV